VSVLLNRGDLTGSSFSFIPQAVEWSKEGDLEVRTIKDVRLLDVGPVTYPAYDGATSFARDTTEAEDELAKIEAEKKEAEAKAQAEADAEEKKKADEEAEKLKADQEAQADLDYADSSITSHKD